MKILSFMFMGMCVATAARVDQDAEGMARQFFPEPLAAESRAEESAGYEPRRFVGATNMGDRWIAAAYSNGYSGSISVIDRTADSPRVIANSTLPTIAGTAPDVELADLDADGAPEILASFADQYGTRTYWIFGWNGETLKLLSTTEGDSVTGVYSDITNPAFVDIDGDGTIEIIDCKYTEERDENGDRSVQLLFTVYSIRNGTMSASASPVTYFGRFGRSKGKPAASEEQVFVERPGIYRLRFVNGDDVASASGSGSVSINHAVVVGPSDFRQGRRTLTKSVSLVAGMNTLSVLLNGQAGATVYILLEPSLDALTRAPVREYEPQ